MPGIYVRYKPGIGTGILKVMYLVRPRVPSTFFKILKGLELILVLVYKANIASGHMFNWYVLQYQYSYQYYIPRLHPIHQYNTGTSRQYIYLYVCVCVSLYVCVYYHNPAIQLLRLHNFPTKSLTKSWEAASIKTQSNRI